MTRRGWRTWCAPAWYREVRVKGRNAMLAKALLGDAGHGHEHSIGGIALRHWGLALWKRLGFKRAATALARKMAVVLHAMWKSGTHHSIPNSASSRHKSNQMLMLTIVVDLSLVASRCPCRDVGEAIPVGSLRPSG